MNQIKLFRPQGKLLSNFSTKLTLIFTFIAFCNPSFAVLNSQKTRTPANIEAASLNLLKGPPELLSELKSLGNLVVKIWDGSGVVLGFNSKQHAIVLTALHVNAGTPQAAQRGSGRYQEQIGPFNDPADQFDRYTSFNDKDSRASKNQLFNRPLYFPEWNSHQIESEALPPDKDFQMIELTTGTKSDLTAKQIFESEFTPPTMPTIRKGLLKKDEPLFIFGFGVQRNPNKDLQISLGEPLSMEEAKALGITNQGIPIDVDYRKLLFAKGFAYGGMSGGPVFDGEGKLVGITVRATPQYIIILRADYALDTVESRLRSTQKFSEVFAPIFKEKAKICSGMFNQ